MMKKLIAFLALCLSLHTMHAQIKFQPRRVDNYLWMNNTWTYSNADIYDYNGRGQTTSRVVLNSKGDSSSKDEYIFDVSGNKTAYSFYIYKGSTWEFTTGNRFTYTYDAGISGKPSSQTDENFINNKWETGSRFTYTYLPDGRYKSIMQSVFFQGNWIDASRVTLNYNTQQQLQDILLESTQNGSWVSEKRLIEVKGEFTIDSFPQDYTMQNFTNGIWENTEKQTTEITDNNGSRKITVLHWINNAWDNYKRFTYEYDSLGKLIFQDTEEGHNGLWESADRNKMTLSYHNDSLMEEIAQVWSPASQAYQNAAKKVYSRYKVITGITEVTTDELRCYPNPAKDMLYIQLPSQQPATIKLMDMQGRTIYSAIANNLDNEIDVSSLPAGIYVLYCRTGAHTYQARVVKE